MTERTCPTCGTDLDSPDRRRKYCSQKCRDRATWDRRPRIPCVECRRPSGWRDSPSQRGRVPQGGPMCRSCARAASTVGPKPTHCASCGAPFQSTRVRDSWTRCCSKSCARRAEIREGRHPLQDGQQVGRDPVKRSRNGELSRRKRRARLAEVEREAYTLAEIAARDGFRCWLCNRKVTMTLAYPHPRSASIDHVVPLSRGGDDTRANVRLAHLGENVARGNRVEWEQQLLIG